MRRRIVGFVRDEAGDWAAQLACLHGKHVRHQPPFRTAPWVLDDAARAQRVGSELDCPLCDRCELPADLRVLRTSPTWDETTAPAGLRRAHRVASGVWGRLRVDVGSLRFVARTTPPTDRTLRTGDQQPIPPDVEHHVELTEPVRFAVDFLGPPDPEDGAGGTSGPPAPRVPPSA